MASTASQLAAPHAAFHCASNFLQCTLARCILRRRKLSWVSFLPRKLVLYKAFL